MTKKNPKVELRMPKEEKAVLQAAADQAALKLATWCKAHLLLAAGKNTGE